MPRHPKVILFAGQQRPTFQSQNYTKEQLSSVLQHQIQQDSAAAPTSSIPTPTLEGCTTQFLRFISTLYHPDPIFLFG